MVAYPVIFLWSQNLGEVGALDVIRTLVVLVAVVAVATWFVGRLLGDVRRGALIVAPLAFGLLMFGHLASGLDGLAANLGSVDLPTGGGVVVAGVPGAAVVGAVLAMLIALGIALALRLGISQLATVDSVLTRLTAILVVVALLPIGGHLVATTARRAGSAAGVAPATAVPTATAGGSVSPAGPTPGAGTTPPPLRDVYWLVFDRYGSDRSLALRYGVQNDLTPWLIDQGFTVLADSHANYPNTAMSLATTANITPIERLDGWAGPDSEDLTFLHEALDGTVVAQRVQGLGYRYLNVGSWWPATSTDPFADANYSAEAVTDFNTVLFDSSALPVLAEAVGLAGEAPSFQRRHWINGRYELEVLARIRDEPGPKFVFAHVLLPHPPEVFARDGSFTTTATGRQAYVDQLAYTNDQLRSLITGLITLPADRRPIIILQADEGPYLERASADPLAFDWATATPEELETKFGILNAWYLPGGEDLGLYPTMTAINTFPVLLSGYFGLDVARLPDRVYTSPAARQLDFTDITDRLPSLQ